MGVVDGAVFANSVAGSPIRPGDVPGQPLN